MIDISVTTRRVFGFIHDVLASALAWCLGYLLRFNFDVPDAFLNYMWQSLVWVVPVQAAIFWLFGLYRGAWRYASLHDLKNIVLAVAFASLAAPVVLVLTQAYSGVPRSVLVLDPLLLLTVMGGSRFAYRMWKEHRIYSLANFQGNPVVVLGSGDAASQLIMNLAHSRDWRVIGILDDDPEKRGLVLHGVTVIGSLADASRVAGKLDVQHGIIAMPEASHTERRRVVEICQEAGLKVMTVPSFDDLVSGRVTVSQLRHVELDDLLGRDPVTLDAAGLRGWLAGRVVMVTGAGGSIGAELARQVARFGPKQLVLFELNEFALYTIEQEFAASNPRLPVVPAIGDVKDAARVEHVIRTHRPSVIFHAAAYKHVPLMESENAWQAVLNNVAGTHVIGRAAAAAGVEKFVFVSTDKAVNPTSVMGASKRLAEMVCQALQRAAGTRFVMVRFGNVLGSTGSVIPKFREQIANGGPVTVTHPQVTRYFMSIPEAVQLVMQAGLMGTGGEIFVLDMGEPVKIADLARDLIRLSGFSEEEIHITYTGLRPGEKLYEEPLAGDENLLPTPHSKLKIARARQENSDWLPRLESWLLSGGPVDDTQVRFDLAKWVPDYSPQ